jgi:putative PIG3 family NAD(P)H quinone oxidoreductase
MSQPLPATMMCVEISAAGGPDVLRAVQRPVPAPAPGEILVEVAAAGVNRPDVLQRLGRYDPPPGASDLPGLEVAGRVAALGEGVYGWAPGEPVCALVAGGGYARYCPVPAPQCLPLPRGVDMVTAAALPECVFTVWTNVFERGQLQPGETFLVHGGSSGIGTTAIQLARAMGARVFATAGTPEKCRSCEALGAERAVDYRSEDFVEVVRAATGGRGVDVVLDMVGGDYVARNIDLLAPDGRHVSIAFLLGPKVTLNLVPVMTKRLILTGSTLRARPVAEKGRIAEAVRHKVWPLVEAGVFRPQVFRTFPLAAAAEAHRLMETSTHTGKIVLTLED